MDKNDFKLYIFDGLYDKDDVNYTFFEATKGYTLIYSDETPSESGFFEITTSVLDANEKAWLVKCQRDMILDSFYDFSETFLSELIDNFERELEIEKQNFEKLDKKEKKKWKKAQRKKKGLPRFNT